MPSDAGRLHGFTVVSGALRLTRQLVLPAIIIGASFGEGIGTIIQWIALILTIPPVALSLTRWLMFRYRLVGDELIIHSGVLSRRRRVIPLRRIQNVDLRQSALERLARVAELRMETASGGGETEASLSVLALQDARDLQAELMRRRAESRGRERAPAEGVAVDGERAVGEAGAGEAVGQTPRLLLRLSIADLALAGATSNEAGLLAAGLATGIELVSDLGGVDRLESWIEAAFTRGIAFGVLGGLLIGVALVLGMIIVGWILSVVVTIVRYHGFTLTREGDEIQREYGLLSRHHSTVPLERVQAVRIEETILRRPFGLVALKIETAGAPFQRQQGAGESEAFVPIARKSAVGPLLREVFPDARFEGVGLRGVSPLCMRRSFLRLAVPIAVATLIGTLARGPVWLALLALLLPAWIYARADFRARAWSRPGGYALMRGGVFTRVNWVVPEAKIQTLHVRQTPFQRRLRLGTLLVDTAAGGRVARVADLDRSTADGLLHGLARDAEAARRDALRPGLRPGLRAPR